MLGPVLLLAVLPSVQVDVPAKAPCELAARLPAALADEGVRVSNQALYRVEVSQVGQTLRFRVSDREGRLLVSRELVPKLDDCEVVPHTLALLLHSALTALPGEPAKSAPQPDLGVRQPAPRAALTERRGAPTGEAERVARLVAAAPDAADAGAGGTSSVGVDSGAGLAHANESGGPIDAGVRASAVDVAPLQLPPAGGDGAEEARDAGGPGAGVPVAAAAIDAGVTAASAQASAPSTDGVARSIGVLAAGGGSLDMTGAPVVQGAAAVEWGFREPWGVALELGLDSRRTVEAPPGRIGVSVYWAELSIRRALVRLDELTGLYAVLGVRGLLMQAEATGFAVGRGEVLLLSGGLRAAVDWRQRIWRGLFAFARVGGLVLVRPEVLFVSGVDPVLVLPAWSAFVYLGLGMRID